MMDPSPTGPEMEARGAAPGTVTVVRRDDALDEVEDPFPYGSRWVEVETSEGRRLREVPLSWEDLFDPQEGDHVAHSIDHGDAISETKERLRCFFKTQGREDVVVCDDVKMLWKDPELAQIAPDIAVIPGVEDRKRYRKSFNEKQEGTRPVFVLEVISEATGQFDKKDKPDIYRRAGVEECFLLDQLTSPWELTGYRPDPATGDYVAIAPDERGRLLSETLGVWFRIAPGGDDLIVEDAVTGELLRKPIEESMARREEAEARATAERQAAREAEARAAAERQAAREAEARRREAEARAAAERQAAREAEARAAAERQAAREAEARAAAEAENQKLLAEIKRLRASRST